MHPNLPLWGKLVALLMGLTVLAGGFVFVALVGPIAGDGLAALGRTAMDRYGTWAGFAIFLALVGGLYLSGHWVNRRATRKEYEQTRTITVEKPHKTPQWAKVMLWGQAGLFVVICLGIFISSVISGGQ